MGGESDIFSTIPFLRKIKWIYGLTFNCLHFCNCVLPEPSHLYFKIVNLLLSKNFTALEATRTIWRTRKYFEVGTALATFILGLDVIYDNIACKIKQLVFQP